VQKGFFFFIFIHNRSYVNNEGWLPSEIDAKEVHRIFLLPHINGRSRVRFSLPQIRADATILPAVNARNPDDRVAPNRSTDNTVLTLYPCIAVPAHHIHRQILHFAALGRKGIVICSPYYHTVGAHSHSFVMRGMELLAILPRRVCALGWSARTASS